MRYSIAVILQKYFRQIKKNTLVLVLVPSLLMPFEQMVFAAKFTAFIKNTNDVNLKNHDERNENSLIKKSLIKKDVTALASSEPSSLNRSSAPPVAQLSTLTSGQGGVASTAGNFHGAWNASVDPRTGNVFFSLTVGSVLYDDGQGKRDLTLSYSGSSSAGGRDTFSLGPRWGFNVGTEQVSPYEVAGHKTTTVVTGDGHGFTMISDRNPRGKTVWSPLHHKLGDVVFTGEPGDWTVSKATDVRERIIDGYAQWEQARDGRKLYFYYDRNSAGDSTRRLTYLCGHQLTVEEQQGQHNACAGDGLWITYTGRSITIHGNQEITLHKGESSGIGNIRAISMPSLSSDSLNQEKAMIRFAYDDQGKRPWLLNWVSYPTGKSKTFLYNDQSSHPGAQIKGLPVGNNGAHIPVVTEVITTTESSGSTEPLTLREWYRYGEVNGHGRSHNYMGYQGEGSIVPGRDNLFDRPDDYTYSVSRDNGLTTTTTTYNKYHLPQLVEQRDNQQKNPLAQSAQKYIPLKGTTFAQLPGNYSLPTGSSKTLYATTESGGDNAIVPAKVVQASRYDNNGQKLWERDAYGRITMTQYCPPEGNERCPVMDSHWPQITKPEKVLMIPAPHSPEGSMPFLMRSATQDDTDPEPAVMTVFDYMRLPATHLKTSTSHAETNTLIQVNAKGSADTSEHFWQVKAKTVGTLPLTAVAHLQPGDTLPELSQGKVSTRTTYRYNTQPHTATYGQLNQLSVIKYRAATPFVKGSALLMAAVPHPVVAQEKITVNVQHEIDREAQTRTTTMKVVTDDATDRVDFKNSHGFKKLQHFEKLNEAESGVSLGTTVYSLATGDKIASHDTLREMQTKWRYDHWGRAIRQEVIPASGGNIQTTHIQYIFTPQEKAVIKTASGGQQFKIVYDAFNWVVSTWHRFADQADRRLEGSRDWIIDTRSTYTATGKPASHTVYHADDPGHDGKPGATIGLTTTYGYDTLNRQVWKKTPDGIITFTVRNDPAMQLLEYQVSTSIKEELAPLLTVTESNILGKPVARYLLPLDPVFKKQAKKLYPPALQNRLKQIINRLQSASDLQTHNTYGLLPLSGSDGLFSFVKKALHESTWLKRTRWEYDGNGRRVRQVQSNGAVTRWIYQQGNLVATVAPDGRVIHDTFNVHGKKVSRCVQPAGSALCHVLGTRGFDEQGNMLWQADEYGQQLHYTWDSNGRMLSMKTTATDEAPEGHIFTYEYNSLGMTSASVDGRPYVTHRYDPDTWQLTDTNDVISHLHYDYDKNTGALIKITRSVPLQEAGITPLAGMDYPSTIQTLTQDRYLKTLSMTDETGNKYTSVHDRLSRVIQQKIETGRINQQKNTASFSTTLTSTTYDHFSRLLTVTNGQGMQRLFSL